MTSRYDRQDPSEDPSYCDGLYAADDSTPELLAQETQNVLNAIKSLRSVLGTTRHTEKLWDLVELAKWWRDEADALAVEAMNTIETHTRNLGSTR